MKDMLNTKHKGCGGIFKEINIYEDIACDKCGQGTERYIYTQIENLKRQNARLQNRIEYLEEKLEKIRNIA